MSKPRYRWQRRVRHPWVFALMLASLVIFCVMLWLPTQYLLVDGSNDKQHHIGFFFGLTLLCWFSLRYHPAWQLCMLLLFAVLSELSQHWVPHRHSSWDDLQANLSGIALGYVLLILIKLGKKFLSKGS
ncbi:VanZ family protein [Bowmanella yangjiangensis]|uniref:VanZ family protein n=1 Tax=Bowmanella yangjiangensis TaxID=2811230 RepID=A0ABS3CS03_9ALTE|nr:VanZ family protein [Bowmanella yangjiangensis]MBN7818941.1 VanZ family protein [Bowmanella yangjiangensis]